MGQFPSGARPALPHRHGLRNRRGCTHPAAAAPAQAGILPVPARNTRSQRPCKAPPRAQVVSGYPLLNPESALRLSILTPSTRRIPAASLTTALRRLPPRRRRGSIQAAHGRRSRAHTGSGIASLARTRRRQRQRRPASCRFRRGTRAHSGLQGPAKRADGLWIPPAQPRIGPQALHSDSQHPLNPGSFTDHGTCDGSPAPPAWVNPSGTARGPAQTALITAVHVAAQPAAR